MYNHSKTTVTVYVVQYQLRTVTLLVVFHTAFQQYQEEALFPSSSTHDFIDKEIKILRV